MLPLTSARGQAACPKTDNKNRTQSNQMIIIISPSKTQDCKGTVTVDSSQPLFIDQVRQLVSHLKKLDRKQLAELMKMSDKLAEVNYRRYQAFQPDFTPENSRPALFMFRGDQFNPMAVEEYTPDQLHHCQHHLRILSGLYGMLRPLDLMQPYRLEMAHKVAIGGSANLYDFWRDRLTGELNAVFGADANPVLVNMASAEYFKVINKKKLQAKILTITFKQEKAGKVKTIAIYAKRARGAMVDFIMRNRLSTPEELQAFRSDGYSFAPELSRGGTEWVFIKKLCNCSAAPHSAAISPPHIDGL